MPKENEIKPIDASLDDVADAIVGNTTKKSTQPKLKPNGTMVVQEAEIHVMSDDDEDYISLTDMTQSFSGQEQLIKNWLQNKNTIEFLGVWERLNNPDFNLVEFHQIREEAGSNRFVMSVKLWADRLNGVGLMAKAGRYGGTFAHKDIALEFGSWLSPEFKLYLIKEFQRFKEIESKGENLEWNIRRALVKVQYRTHTDAVKAYLIPPEISKIKEGYIYATEADLLNVAIFGKTAKEWKSENPTLSGTQRDNASTEQLLVLASLESQNALLIEQGVAQKERLMQLNELARKQMKSLLTNPTAKKLTDKPLFNS